MAAPRIQYANSGDLSIAYRVEGNGPLDVVFVPGFVSHVELASEHPAHAHIAARLGGFSRTVFFDKRGTGLSDRTAGLPTLAERMDDIRAVMDAAGLDRAAVIGVSEGGPTAALFAATYPERVTALVLWVTAVAPPLAELDPGVQELVQSLTDFILTRWGDGSVSRLLMPDMPEDPETLEFVRRYERNAATPAAAAAVWQRGFMGDHRPMLSAISAPTLVLEHTDDPFVSSDIYKDTATRIPGAKLVELQRAGHASWFSKGMSDDLDVIEEFLTGTKHTAVLDRVLATVLYTDIVESTERVAEMGDAGWKELLDAHDAAVRRELSRYRGREIFTKGDEFLAAFDGPARAVECAVAVQDAARRLGLEVRAGVHTGECEVRGDDLAGIALHVGARVMAAAKAGEVLVTSTVRDLVAGSRLQFDDAGTHQLKGVPGEWRLLRVVA